MKTRKTLQQRLETALACYERNLRAADAVRGTDQPRLVRRHERAAERAWLRVDSLRYRIAREKVVAPAGEV